jgi:hypothetical protein
MDMGDPARPINDHIINLGTSGILRVQANTRVHLTLAYQGDSVIKTRKGTLGLKGTADNLKTGFEAQLVWLIERPGSSQIEELPHHWPVDVVPSEPSATPLKSKPFTLRQVVTKNKETTQEPLGWDIFSIGLFGHGKIGFRLKPNLPFVDEATLLPASSGLSLDIPLDVTFSPSTDLRVGSKISLKIDSRRRNDEISDLIGTRVRLKVWEGEDDSIPNPCRGHQSEFDLENAVHTEDVRLGIDQGKLWYRLDESRIGAGVPVTFRYALTQITEERNPKTNASVWVDKPIPMRKATIVAAPAPNLKSWEIKHTSGDHFVTSGQIDNFDPSYMPPLSITLRSFRRNGDGSIDNFGALVAGTKRGELKLDVHRPDPEASPEAAASNPDAGVSESPDAAPMCTPDAAAPPAPPTDADSSTGAAAGGISATSLGGGKFSQSFTVEDPNGELSKVTSSSDATILLFATLRVSSPANANQPFAQLIGYQANTLGRADDNTGFAPFQGNDLALLETGTEVCTDGANYKVERVELESPAMGKDPPDEHGPPYAPLTWQDCMLDFAPFEGFMHWMYKDVKGLITVGIGVLINNAINVDLSKPADQEKVRGIRSDLSKRHPELTGLLKAISLPFVNTEAGRLATPEEIAAEFKALLATKSKTTSVDGKPPKIQLPSGRVIELFKQHLEDFYKWNGRESSGAIKEVFPLFDQYPRTAKRALIDLIYGHGKGKEADHSGIYQYKTLMKAVRESPPNWEIAAKEGIVKAGQKRRNDWRVRMFKHAALVERERRPASPAGGSH